MGVEVTDAITPSPSPAGTAVRKLRNSPARAAAQAYSATMICTTTNGQKVGLRSVFTADVTTPVAIPTPGPARAVATGEDQNVPDVAAIGNYLACNLETKSELVVLIRRGQTTLGQLDIDSDVPAGFTESHHRAVKEIADALAVLL